MAIRILPVPYGRPATQALCDEIFRAKAGDPLAPVTVLVPRGAVSLSVRRLLSSGVVLPSEAGDSPSTAGVANVTFTTLPRVAEQLAAPSLAADGRRPLSSASLHATVRAALAHEPGRFEPVRSHPATVWSLAQLWRELRPVAPPTRAQLAAQSPRAAEVLRLLDEVTNRLAPGHYDEHDLLVAAVSMPSVQRIALTPGVLLVHLPERLSPVAVQLLQGLATDREYGEVTVLVGDVPDDRAQQPALELAAALGTELPPTRGPALTAERFLCAPTADAEVRLALRGVLDELHNDTPLDRIAVLYATDAPYARLLRDECTRNGIPFHGPGTRALASTLAGRTLLGVLEAALDDWPRRDVLAWLSSTQIVHDGLPAPTALWDRASRAAGVIGGTKGGGARDWDEKLTMYAAALRDERTGAGEDRDPPSRARLAAIDRELAACESFAAFMLGLATRLDPEVTPRSWRTQAAHASDLLTALLGGPRTWDTWDAHPDERQAVNEVLGCLERLGTLDAVEPSPDPRTFLQALRAELLSGAPTTTRTGVGLLLAPIHYAVGLDLDLVVIVGMTDRALPGRRVAHPLLPDDERSAVDDDVPLHAHRIEDAHRRFLAAAAAAPRRVLCHPTGDARTGRELRPSRWWLDALAASRQLDSTLYAGSLREQPPGDDLCTIPSLTETVRAPGQPVGVHDHDLRMLLAHRTAGGGHLSAHWLAHLEPGLARALYARRERRSPRFTRFDGELGRLAAPPTSFSPTALETYTGCPRRYLFARLLHIDEPLEPERILRLGAMHTGTLVHRVMERFLLRQTELPPDERIAPDVPWQPDDHSVLDTILDEEAAALEAAGATGHPVLWEVDLRVVRRQLHALLNADSALRARLRAVPHRVEAAVGVEGTPPLEHTLPSGRTLRFRGVIDRLDRLEGGGAVVLDYKHSTRVEHYEAIHDDPVAGGTTLQPVLYALMARQLEGITPGPVLSGYWLTKAGAGDQQVLAVIDDEAVARFDEVVTVLIDSITAGAFPPRPGPAEFDRMTGGTIHSACRFCPYDRVCQPERERTWLNARNDPSLHAYTALVEPEQEMSP